MCHIADTDHVAVDNPKTAQRRIVGMNGHVHFQRQPKWQEKRVLAYTYFPWGHRYPVLEAQREELDKDPAQTLRKSSHGVGFALGAGR